MRGSTGEGMGSQAHRSERSQRDRRHADAVAAQPDRALSASASTHRSSPAHAGRHAEPRLQPKRNETIGRRRGQAPTPMRRASRQKDSSRGDHRPPRATRNNSSPHPCPDNPLQPTQTTFAVANIFRRIVVSTAACQQSDAANPGSMCAHLTRDTNLTPAVPAGESPILFCSRPLWPGSAWARSTLRCGASRSLFCARR